MYFNYQIPVLQRWFKKEKKRGLNTPSAREMAQPCLLWLLHFKGVTCTGRSAAPSLFCHCGAGLSPLSYCLKGFGTPKMSGFLLDSLHKPTGTPTWRLIGPPGAKPCKESQGTRFLRRIVAAASIHQRCPFEENDDTGIP